MCFQRLTRWTPPLLTPARRGLAINAGLFVAPSGSGRFVSEKKGLLEESIGYLKISSRSTSLRQYGFVASTALRAEIPAFQGDRGTRIHACVWPLHGRERPRRTQPVFRIRIFRGRAGAACVFGLNRGIQRLSWRVLGWSTTTPRRGPVTRRRPARQPERLVTRRKKSATRARRPMRGSGRLHWHHDRLLAHP